MKSGERVLCSRATLAALLQALLGCSQSVRPPSLGEPLGVEQRGGTVSQLLAQGTRLPASATETFTSARDGEQRLLLHVVRGAEARGGEWFAVEGVAPAPAGTANVVVTFELDGKGQLAVSAREGSRRLATRAIGAPDASASLAPLAEPDEPDEGLEKENE